jgi:cytoskeletal protein RodZ
LASSSSQAEEKKIKSKQEKTIEKKRNAEKEGSLPSSSHSVLSLLAFYFWHFVPNAFSLASFFFFQVEKEKEKHKEKKNHREEKILREGRELTFLLLLLHLG